MGSNFLNQFVKSAKEVELSLALDEIEPWFYRSVVEFGVGGARVEKDRNSFDQITELSENILREQFPLICERLDIPTDCLVSVLYLLANRSHNLSSPFI